MLGAIIGDIVGSRFAWNNNKSKDFDYLPHNDKSGVNKWIRFGSPQTKDEYNCLDIQSFTMSA